MGELRLPTAVDWYAGIGSRRAPPDILDLQTRIARAMAALGWGCRSGGAKGSDTAYEAGAGPNCQVFVPYHGYKGYPLLYPLPQEAYALGARFHPNWQNLQDFAKDLMARNGQQILGPNLDQPSKFVSCWTPDGCESGKTRSPATGGTGQAISIASAYGIPVFNLANPDSYRRIMNWLESI